MAKDWIDPSEAAKMIHGMNIDYFRKRFINPETRDNSALVIQQSRGPKGHPRYKVLTISVIRYLQSLTITTNDGDKQG